MSGNEDWSNDVKVRALPKLTGGPFDKQKLLVSQVDLINVFNEMNAAKAIENLTEEQEN